MRTCRPDIFGMDLCFTVIFLACDIKEDFIPKPKRIEWNFLS